jgi:glycogen operon protein
MTRLEQGIHTFINDSHLLEHGLTNYWGTAASASFAPDPRCAHEPAAQRA